MFSIKVGVVIFSDDIRVITNSNLNIDPCYSSELAKATPANIKQFISFINAISPNGKTVYSLALEKAFRYFNETREDPNDPRTRGMVHII